MSLSSSDLVFVYSSPLLLFCSSPFLRLCSSYFILFFSSPLLLFSSSPSSPPLHFSSSPLFLFFSSPILLFSSSFISFPFLWSGKVWQLGYLVNIVYSYCVLMSPFTQNICPKISFASVLQNIFSFCTVLPPERGHKVASGLLKCLSHVCTVFLCS